MCVCVCVCVSEEEAFQRPRKSEKDRFKASKFHNSIPYF